MHPLLSETLDSFHFIFESKLTLPYPWNTLSYQAHSVEFGIKLKKIQSEGERRVRNKKGGGSGKLSSKSDKTKGQGVVS